MALAADCRARRYREHIGHNYFGHDYAGHNCTGHNYVVATFVQIVELDDIAEHPSLILDKYSTVGIHTIGHDSSVTLLRNGKARPPFPKLYFTQYSGALQRKTSFPPQTVVVFELERLTRQRYYAVPWSGIGAQLFLKNQCRCCFGLTWGHNGLVGLTKA